MRQRLGIANALIGEPEVLILDEPANGLDPEGMRWMRGLLRDFAERGGTVLLSSHLLHEVDVIADRLVIIGGGRIVAEGSRDELLSHTGTQVRADDDAALGRALADAGLAARAAEGGGYLVDAEPRAVGAAAQKGGVALVHLAPAGDAGLEQLFFDLTSRERRTSRRMRAQKSSADAIAMPAAAGRDTPAEPVPPDQGRAAQDGQHPQRLLAAARGGWP